ncbi:MAG TPA: hypothetical protein VNM14_09650 [Planctomycetota bacterium]|jgi:hypothetical protein|nr:hypothetical protein [Planctomycetota bacterium]
MNMAKLPGDSVDIPLLGAAGGNLRFELLLAGADLEAKDDPFVPLSDSSRFARVLLGRVASGVDHTLHPIAVKIQRSFYRPAASASSKETLTNPLIEEMWRRERETLIKCAGAQVVPLIDLGEELFRNRPITFCKKVRAYFHPLCPRCRGPLQDCRDDALLRDHGLPEYSKSIHRYLHCAACAAGPGRKTFYTTSPGTDENLKGEADVRRRGELYRDFGAIVNTLTEEQRATLSVTFPCAACLYREECYPPAGAAGKSIPAETRLLPVSYYEFHLLPLEVMELHYDELSDLVGGASWQALRDRLRQSGAPGRESVLAAVDDVFTSPIQWIYRQDTSGKFPLEILHLKLNLFSQLCHGLRAYHARVREPHLDVSPAQVMVDVVPGSTNLPARWTFRTRLIGAAGPHRFPTAGAPAGALPDLLVPAPDADRIFVSPFVRKAEFGREESLRVTVRSVKADGGRVKIEGSASSDRARLENCQPGDVLRLIPASAGPLEGLTLWGTVDAPEERGVRFTALVDAASGFDSSKKPADFDASVAFFPRFQVPCDLFGLGMLLFRTLLVNDGTDLLVVDDAVHRVLKKLGLWLEGKKSPAAARVAGELMPIVEREREVFGSCAVFYLQEDREERPRALPQRLWSDVLLFGFKLLTSIEGFSYATGHADFPADHPEGMLDLVMTELAGLEDRVRIELFSKADRDREISDVCNELMDELAP